MCKCYVLRLESKAYIGHVSISVLRSICRAYTGYASALCYARQLLGMSVIGHVSIFVLRMVFISHVSIMLHFLSQVCLSDLL